MHHPHGLGLLHDLGVFRALGFVLVATKSEDIGGLGIEFGTIRYHIGVGEGEMKNEVNLVV